MKCKKCKTYVARRYCLRTNKNLCLFCCNDYKIDWKCPSTCKYHITEKKLSSEGGSFFDCIYEYHDFYNKYIKSMILKPSDLFDGQIPFVLKNTEEGRKTLYATFSKFTKNKKILKIYEKNLDINLKSEELPEENCWEDVAQNFLDYIMNEKWDNLSDFFAYKDNQTIATIIKILKDRKELIKLTHFIIYAAGVAANGDDAFVAIEMDYQNDLTIILTKIKNKWLIKTLYFGGIELINAEHDFLKHIVSDLSQGNYSKALKTIKLVENIYFLSPDVQNYKGLYYSIKQNNKEALEAYQTAEMLDRTFTDVVYNQALIYQANNDIENARELYYKTLKIDPNHLAALNNIGTICLYEKDLEAAKSYFQKCLQINSDFKPAIENLKKIDTNNDVKTPCTE